MGGDHGSNRGCDGHASVSDWRCGYCYCCFCYDVDGLTDGGVSASERLTTESGDGGHDCGCGCSNDANASGGAADSHCCYCGCYSNDCCVCDCDSGGYARTTTTSASVHGSDSASARH